MTPTRRVLGTLKKNELLSIAKSLDVEVIAKMNVDELLDAVGTSKRATLDVILKSSPLLERKKAPRIKQDYKKGSITCSRTPPDGWIDWNKPAEQVFNLIRGLSPYPGAFTELNGKILKVFKAGIIEGSGKSGELITDGTTFIRFACREGIIDCKEIQLEGKKRMQVYEFLRGNKLPDTNNAK